ncbi:MAG: PcfK-like family protein, partial [Tannerellaceae bacterium]
QAASDELFAPVYAKENKNIDDCITYILNQVQKSGCNGFSDDEIFGMAIHYYQEDDIDPGKAIWAKVVINHSVEKQGVSNKKQAPVVEMPPSKKTKPRKSHKTGNIPSDQLTLF